MNYGIKTGDGEQSIIKEKTWDKVRFSNAFEMFKTDREEIHQVPSSSTLNITHNFLYTPVFLIYTKSNINAGYKMLSVAARSLTGLRTWTTTTTTSVVDTSGGGARECFVNILEDPISLS